MKGAGAGDTPTQPRAGLVSDRGDDITLSCPCLVKFYIANTHRMKGAGAGATPTQPRAGMASDSADRWLKSCIVHVHM
jgi:hypothetical protein